MNDILLSSISKTELQEFIVGCIKSAIQNQALPQQLTQDDYIDTKEAMKILGVSKPTIAKWRLDGKLTFYRVNSRIRFKRSELMDAFTAPKKYGKDNL